MKVSKVASLTIAAALALTACGNEETDKDNAGPSSSNSSESEESLDVPEQDSDEPEDKSDEPSPGPTPTIPREEDDEEHLHGDVAPGPDGVMPPQVIPYGDAGYRSSIDPGADTPFEWAPTLLEVECGNIDPQDLNDEFGSELTDPLILDDDRELCSVTVSYENIGEIAGVPTLPEGVIIETVLHAQPSDPALETINRLKLEFELREPLAPGVSLELETYLVAPADEEIDAVYFGPDSSEVEIWLLTEED